MAYFPEARRAAWRLRRAIVDLRLAKAELKVSKLRLKLALIDEGITKQPPPNKKE